MSRNRSASIGSGAPDFPLPPKPKCHFCKKTILKERLEVPQFSESQNDSTPPYNHAL